MIDTKTALKEASLLRDNKRELINSIRGFGFSEAELPDDAPLGDLAEKIKYACGFLQPRLAMYNTRTAAPGPDAPAGADDPRFRYFTAQEWLAESTPTDYKLIGLELRIDGKRFILSGKRGTYSSFASPIHDYAPLEYYGYEREAGLTHASGEQETKNYLEYLSNDAGVDITLVSNARSYAVISAYQYEAFEGDPLKGKWYLPSAAEMELLLKYHVEIEKAISLLRDDNHRKSRYATSDLDGLDANIWTSTSIDKTYGYAAQTGKGILALAIKGAAYNVRPLAAIPTT